MAASTLTPQTLSLPMNQTSPRRGTAPQQHGPFQSRHPYCPARSEVLDVRERRPPGAVDTSKERQRHAGKLVLQFAGARCSASEPRAPAHLLSERAACPSRQIVVRRPEISWTSTAITASTSRM